MSLSACDVNRKVHLQSSLHSASPADLLRRNPRLESCTLGWHSVVGAWDKACVYTAGVRCVRNEQTHILMPDWQRHGQGGSVDQGPWQVGAEPDVRGRRKGISKLPGQDDACAPAAGMRSQAAGRTTADCGMQDTAEEPQWRPS